MIKRLVESGFALIGNDCLEIKKKKFCLCLKRLTDVTPYTYLYSFLIRRPSYHIRHKLGIVHDQYDHMEYLTFT